ncbi:SDR family NAD(P)-dependent oxidoreductase [Lactobacillus sp. S2-2]|uniref:oxidoreductase n=1 Tax=Lactobacillus sp. S2-2 TaxID=2692917 RepID=UPI001F1B8949|nr:oxidoreductase [Lactobacillus sp. S2-2]MCF6515224.1 SDR family NAD(P)-dependent oxidoreductase [Lactobacillus sp. S2-2]
MIMQNKVILITGATSGIGYQTAKLLAEQGYQVYGAGRRVDKLEPLKEIGVRSVKLDITDEDSIKSAVDQVIRQAGKIDVLINNAGYGSYGAIEDVSIEEAKRQFDVNLFGLAKLTQLVLPYMRKQKSGRIINTSSMAGRMTSYFGAWYHATKYALEGFSDALRMEVKQFGIEVALIEPGSIKTDWGLIAANNLESSSKNGAYEVSAKKAAQGMRKLYLGKMVSDPIIISNAILKAVNKKKPRTRYLIGFGAKPLVFLHTILPNRFFDYLMMHVV